MSSSVPGPEAIKMNKILRLRLSVYWEETQPCTVQYGSRIIDVGAAGELAEGLLIRGARVWKEERRISLGQLSQLLPKRSLLGP